MRARHLFLEFTTRVHRRRLVWRAIEFWGIGLLCGCALAGTMLPLMWWRGVDGVAPAAALLIISGIAGWAASFARRPSLLDTALHVERMLKSPELLSSAMLADRESDFGRAVATLADARVAGVSPSSVIAPRLSGRAWSGVGLASAAVLIVAMMISAPVTPGGQFASASPEPLDIARGKSQPARSKSQTLSDTVPAAAERSMVSNDASRVDGGASSEARSRSTRDRPPQTSGADSTSAGGGSSKSDDPAATESRLSRSNVSQTDRPGEKFATGSGSESSAIMSSARHAGAADAAGEADRSGGDIHAAPWTTASWPADRAAAVEALRRGAIPDAYRSLVRDYFDLH